MPSQREIRRRIGSVKNIKQITRAMQFVAASKLKRAQDATLQSRPYRVKLDEVLADVAAVLDGDEHPLLGERPWVPAWSCCSPPIAAWPDRSTPTPSASACATSSIPAVT